MPITQDFSKLTIKEAARIYRARGFAIVPVLKGLKNPIIEKWTHKSFELNDFTKDDNIGIMTGRLSGDLVCIDLDSEKANSLADDFLPVTHMIDGRPGKQRSHRWYKVANIPTELTAAPKVAGGVGGPKTIHGFKTSDDEIIIDVQGTGAHAVVPPSLWVSDDGSKQEKRVWHKFGEPTVIDYSELFEKVKELARASGWIERKARQSKSKRSKVTNSEPIEILPMPIGELSRRARSYVGKIEGAVEGQGGDAKTYYVACVLVIGFGLKPDEALPILWEYNQRCIPVWTKEQLLYKLDRADDLEGVRGSLLRKSPYFIQKRLEDKGGVIYVGVDCASYRGNFVDLKPSLYAGLVKVCKKYELVPELAQMEWAGRDVVIVPTSTILTNSREVWSEFFLARLLRERGANVLSLRLPPLNGRKRTLSQADGTEYLVEPPFKPEQVDDLALAARNRAKELNRYRKSLNRKRVSVKFEKAVDFIRQNGITELTGEAIQKAKELNIGKTTLWKALYYNNTILNTTNT